ncbi:MAG: hypothetical protein ACRD7E_21715 [Bryobacteraceae bacterium]
MAHSASAARSNARQAFAARCFLLAMLLVEPPAFGQQFRMDMFHGRKAYVLENELIRVSALRGGGHIAEVRFRSDDERKSVNPMRVPHYPTIEPYEYDPARHDELYGSDSHRWLSSGYMGHLLCFPALRAAVVGGGSPQWTRQSWRGAYC